MSLQGSGRGSDVREFVGSHLYVTSAAPGWVVKVEIANNGVDFTTGGIEFTRCSHTSGQCVAQRGPISGGTLLTLTDLDLGQRRRTFVIGDAVVPAVGSEQHDDGVRDAIDGDDGAFSWARHSMALMSCRQNSCLPSRGPTGHRFD